jgi:hypothetical protein
MLYIGTRSRKKFRQSDGAVFQRHIVIMSPDLITLIETFAPLESRLNVHFQGVGHSLHTVGFARSHLHRNFMNLVSCAIMVVM